MMTSAQVVETSVNVTSNSPSQDYTHPDDHNLPNYDMTPGFKPFTEEMNVKKILAVTNATYAVAKRKPEKIRLAGIRTLTSAIPVQRSNQLS